MDDDVRNRIRQARIEPRVARSTPPGVPQAAQSTVPMEGMNSVPSQMVGPSPQPPTSTMPITPTPQPQQAYQPATPSVPQPQQVPIQQQSPVQQAPAVDPMSGVTRIQPATQPQQFIPQQQKPEAVVTQPPLPTPEPQAVAAPEPVQQVSQAAPYTGPTVAPVSPVPAPVIPLATMNTQQPIPSKSFEPGPEHKKSKKPLIIAAAIIGVVLLGTGGYFAWHQMHQVAQGSPASAKKVASIPVYNAKNLPSGYVQNNDLKALKSDVIYYSVTGPNKEVYYVTQQPIPANFDFVAFNKKFANQLSFNTESGSAVIGQIGSNMIGSVKTAKNTWVIINATNVKNLSALELVARSLVADR